ncbi:MAG: quinolinate synthase NadA [Elusimicrobiota bacterium]|jgi:quinolinate synthase|nr:quinolinate synthase NadA [Elusimicrobiota bacterium]
MSYGGMINEVELETQRLYKILGGLTDFKIGAKYDAAFCRAAAPFTLEINKLKKETDAVILAHYYCAPQIVYGVADYKGDSLALARAAAEVKESIIIFCGVFFMAQTAKIINPRKRVFLPPLFAGCSLADSVDAAQAAAMRAKYPRAQFVCYINSTAEVKAACDICVTSANVFDIIAASAARQIVFLPDVYMAADIAREMRRRGIDKEIIPFGGTCCVHDKYNAQDVRDIRAAHPAAAIICHPECAPQVCELCDYCGGTSGMLKFVKSSAARTFAVLSEDGIINCLEYENPDKNFLHYGRTCAQMKRNNLQNILGILKNPAPEAEVQVGSSVADAAKKCIYKMFKAGGADL